MSQAERYLKREWLNDYSILSYKPNHMMASIMTTWSADVLQALKEWQPGKPYLLLYDLAESGVSMAYLVFLGRDVFNVGITISGRMQVEQLLRTQADRPLRLALVLSSSVSGKLASQYGSKKEILGTQVKAFFDREPALQWLSELQVTSPVTHTTILNQSYKQGPVKESGFFGKDLFTERNKLVLFVEDSIEHILLAEDLSIVMGRRIRADDPVVDLDLNNYGEKSASVSRRHARLHVENDHLYLTDLGSTNGTWLAGQRLESYKPMMVRENDGIIIGALKIQVLFK